MLETRRPRKLTEIDEAVDCSQHMIGRRMYFEQEVVKQST